MNSFSALFVLLVLSVVALTNVAGKPSQEGNDANTITDNGYGNPNCGRNEVPSACSANPRCQETCDNLGQPIPCPRSALVANSCVPGCVCRDGFVRVVRGDQCIPRDKCEGRVRH